MRLELEDIKGGELEQGYSFSSVDFPDLVAIADGGGPTFDDSISFLLRFQRTGQFVEVDGSLTASVGLVCGRCLRSFTVPLVEAFTLTFVPLKSKDENETEEEIELESAELGLISYEEQVLELLEPLQEQLLMAVPISPVCQSECLGLCPECGQDMNLEKCDCTRRPFNNKFTALANIDFKKS